MRPRAWGSHANDMSESAHQERPCGDSPLDREARVRRALREARTEAVVVLAGEVALLVGLALIDEAKGWGILDFSWWAWLLLALPALSLLVLLLAAPLAELRPGRLRDTGVVLLALLVAADALAVVVLLIALGGS